jgi:tetratricopeptide (TPR) repeat protein
MGSIVSVPAILDSEEYIDTNNNENKESTTLIWFDPNIESREDTEETKQQLRLINDYVKFHTNLDQCVKFIQSRDKEKIFLITSGSKASQLLPHIASLRQVDSIFIFCMKKERYEHLMNEYPKIIGIYIDLNELCQSIEQQIDLVDKQLQTFSFFDQHQKSTKDLSKESSEFLWFQLFNYVIARLPRNQQAKQQMIEICKQYYRGNVKELKLIDEFDREYQSENAIRWYSKQSFAYKLINQALRTEDIDLLYIFRFFIGDLSDSLRREHEKILSSTQTIITTYRGVKLDKEEFDKLNENQGKLISTNGYLSTSRIQERALRFAMKKSKRIDIVSVLFEIQCDIQLTGRSIIFADVTELSEYPEEQEVLFDLNTCFRIESIKEHESIQLIRMRVSNEGEIITKDYIERTQKETEEKSVSIVFGKLMCNLGQYDKSQRYFEQLLIDPNGEDIAWIEFNIGRALYFKGEQKQAREYYDRAYKRMMNIEQPRIKDSAQILNNIGLILENQENYDEALEYYQQALKIKEKLYQPGDVVTSLNNIGNIFSKQKNYTKALEYHQQALNIKKKCYQSGHVSLAASLNNIGVILKEQGKYDEALDHHQRALEILEKHYSRGHVDIAKNFICIGNIFHQKGKYNETLNYYQHALEMQIKICPLSYADIANNLDNIGTVFSDQKNYNQALVYYQRALKMREKYCPFEHVNIATSLNNICNILYKQENYVEALIYYKQILKMQEKSYPSGHVDIATSLYNIGNILHQLKEYDEALDYYQQALNMRENCYPSGHVDIGHSLNNIGACYFNQNNRQMALCYYQRALSIYERLLPIEHPDRVRTEDNIRRLAGTK